MTHQQRSSSGNKSKERVSSGGKSKPNNFMRLSLPGDGSSIWLGVVGPRTSPVTLVQDSDCWESSSSTEGYPRILLQRQDIILRRSSTDWPVKLWGGIWWLLWSDLWRCRTIFCARSRVRTRTLPGARRRRWRRTRDPVLTSDSHHFSAWSVELTELVCRPSPAVTRWSAGSVSSGPSRWRWPRRGCPSGASCAGPRSSRSSRTEPWSLPGRRWGREMGCPSQCPDTISTTTYLARAQTTPSHLVLLS